MVICVLSRICASAEMGDAILTQKIFSLPYGGGGKVGRLWEREVCLAVSENGGSRALLGCDLCD